MCARSSDEVDLGNEKNEAQQRVKVPRLWFIDLYYRSSGDSWRKLIWNLVQAWWSRKMIRHLKRLQGPWRENHLITVAVRRLCTFAFFFSFFNVGKHSENLVNLRVRCVPIREFGISITNLIYGSLLAVRYFALSSLWRWGNLWRRYWNAEKNHDREK